MASDWRFGTRGAALVFGTTGLVALRFLLPPDADVADDAPRLARPTGVLIGLGAMALLALLAEGSMGDWSAVYLRLSLGTSAGLAAVGHGKILGVDVPQHDRLLLPPQADGFSKREPSLGRPRKAAVAAGQVLQQTLRLPRFVEKRLVGRTGGVAMSPTVIAQFVTLGEDLACDVGQAAHV